MRAGEGEEMGKNRRERRKVRRGETGRRGEGGAVQAKLPFRCLAVPPPLVCWRGSCAARCAAARHATQLLAAVSDFWPIAARSAHAAHAAHAAARGPFSPPNAAPSAALPRVRPGAPT